MNIGLIGMGLLGSALAERLLDAGFDVVGFDVRDAARRDHASRGGHVVASANDVAGSAQRLFLCLPDSGVAAGVLDEIEPALATGTIVFDVTTGAPEAMAGFAERLEERGVHYLDACLAGSSEQARRGEALILAGGDDEAFAACEELFAAIGQRAWHLGPAGSGARMKLVVNLVLGLNRAVLAEGLSLAKACGIDPALALEILQAGPAFSRVMQTKGEKMLREDFTPEARLAQHHKDVRLIQELGQQHAAKLPLTDVHEALLAKLVEQGFGELDNSAVIKGFDACGS